MMEVFYLLLSLPLPALITLIIALACLGFILLILLAFVPNMAEKIIALLNALKK